jgi:hypothetical protein
MAGNAAMNTALEAKIRTMGAEPMPENWRLNVDLSSKM